MNEEPEVIIESENNALIDRSKYRNIIRMLRSEIESEKDQRKAALLCFEIGRIFEFHMNDFFQASAHYQEALSKVESFLPAIRALRRIALERKNWSNFISLTDREISLTGDSLKRAILWAERAEVLYEQLDNVEEATISIHKSLELDPSNIKALVIYLNILSENKEYNKLVKVLKTLSEKVKSKNLINAILYEAGRITEYHLQDIDTAIKIYEEILSRNGGETPVMNSLIRLYFRKKMYRPLVKLLLNKASKSAGRSKARTLYTVARILHERLSEISEAIEALEEAHRADPDSDLIIGEMVRLCQLVGQHEKLAYYYERQIKLCSDSQERSAIYLRLGQLYEENLMKDDKAEFCYQKAIEENPLYLPAFIQLANFYNKRGQLDNLVAMHIKEAEITESPMRRAMAYHRAAELRESQGKTEEAIDLYNKAITMIPTFNPSFNALERLLEKTGNYTRLVLLYQERFYIEENQALKIALMEKTARILEERLNNKEGAYKVYNEILNVDPSNSSALSALIRISAEHELWHDHVNFLLKEVDISTDEQHVVDTLQRIGEIYEHQIGDLSKAIETYRRLLSISPFNPHVIRNLGRIYHKQGMFKELVELHRSELGASIEPEERSMILYKIGAILENKMNDESEAVSAYKSALMESPRNMAASWALYRIYRKNNDWMSILELLENEALAIPEGHQRALAMVRIGELWEDMLGRSDMAYDSLNQALRMEPGLHEARESLLRLCEQDGNYEYLVELLFQEYQTSVDPDDQYNIALILGELWLDKMHNPKEAAEWFLKSLSVKSSAILPLWNLDSTFRATGEWKSLLEIEEKLIENISDEEVKAALIGKYLMIKSRLGARSFFGQEKESPVFSTYLLDKNPMISYGIFIEQMVKSSGSIEAMIEWVERLKEIQKDDPVCGVILEYIAGETLLRKGAYRDAFVRFENAHKIDPENIIPMLFMENIAYELKDAENYTKIASKLNEKIKNPAVKAQILYRTALMKMEILGNFEEGISLLMEGIRQDPENEEIFNELMKSLEKQERWNELVSILEEVSERVHSPERISDFFSLLGNLQWKYLGDYSKAIKSLNKVLKFDPHKIPALLGLLDLYIAKEEINEAVAVGRFILNNITDSGAYLTAALKMADLALMGEVDPGELIGILENILSRTPGHKEVEEKLVMLYGKNGEWEKSVMLLEKLSQKEQDSNKKLNMLLEMAEIYETRLQQSEKAMTLLDRILEDWPDNEIAIRRKVELLKKSGNLDKAESVIEDVVKFANIEDGLAGGIVTDLLVELAQIKRIKTGSYKVYLENLLRAFRSAPLSEKTTELILQSIKEAGENESDDLKGIINQMLENQPFNLSVLNAAVDVFGKIGEKDRQMIVACMLFYMGSKLPHVQECLTRYKKESLQNPNRPIMEEDIAKVRLDNINHPARKLVDLISNPPLKVFSKRHSFYGVHPSDNLLDRKREGVKDRDIVIECKKAADFLGVKDYEVYIIPDEGYEPVVDYFDAPAILLPFRIVELSNQEQAILITIALSQIRFNNWIPMKLTPTDFEALLIALVRMFKPGFGAGFSQIKIVEKMMDQIKSDLSKKHLKVIEGIIQEYIESSWFDMEEWHLKIKITSNRFALLRTGDISAMLDSIKKREPDLVGVPVSDTTILYKALMKNELAKNTAAFFMSSDYTDLWRKYFKCQ